jgi:hypothetical protein
MTGKIADADAKQLAKQEKAEKIIELRRTGATWELIAKATGYANPSGAYKAYQKILESMVFPKLEEYRHMELDLYDRLQLSVYERAKNGDMRAIETILKISDRRRSIIGLDAPSKIQAEVITYDGAILEQHTARIVEMVRLSREPQGDMGSGTGETRAITDGD